MPMPINAYTGLMGSGKSYECVESVIVPAIRSGRRVVTNVDGIDGDAIRAYCHEKFGADLAELGQVVHCTNDDVGLPDFLPYGKDVQTFCLPGDMICIDEAWRFWGTDCKPLAEHKIFFREHRHYVHPDTKVCCDLVLMVQDISDLHRVLKVVVEVSFRTTKIKSLGLSRVYRVEMWEGYKQLARSRVSVHNKKYNPEIFPLYSSYSGGSGKELQVDARQNILRSKTLWLYLLFLVIAATSGVTLVYRFFNREPVPTSEAASLQPQQQSASLSGSVSPAAVAGLQLSDTWRIAGVVKMADVVMVVLASSGGSLRLEHPSNFQSRGLLMVGELDGKTITTWSGGSSQGSLLPGSSQ